MALVRPRTEIAAQLRERIELGKKIRGRPINSDDSLASAASELRRWRDYNLDLLKALFSTDVMAEEYSSACLPSRMAYTETEALQIQLGTVDRQIEKLESITERLGLYPELSGDTATVSPKTLSRDLSKVFVVHGHDGEPREAIARFLERLGLEAIILHERPNKGRTIITKFREEAAGLNFAVVLMTPDDLGKAEHAADLRYRARQNVVFELGFFVGALGPEHVAALVKGDIERPSDLDGVVYISLDEADWQMKLAVSCRRLATKSTGIR